MAARRQSIQSALPPINVRRLIRSRALQAHFQPIVQLRDGKVVAHESLIRGPEGSALRAPDALFAAARSEGVVTALEEACLQEALRGWDQRGRECCLFVNLSAEAILKSTSTGSLEGILGVQSALSVPSTAVVIEITEHERVSDLAALVGASKALRGLGIRFALDDFGDGRSSLRLWAELLPEFVKIDKYFVRDVDQHAFKVQTLNGITRFAETFGTTLLAEGIETDAELRIVRDLGIKLGQGYFLGRPQQEPALTVLPAAASAIASSQIAVLPEMTRAANAGFVVGNIAMRVRTLDPRISNDAAAEVFAANPALRALALVDGGLPVGLLNRQVFHDRYARPYFKELHGRKSCMLYANSTPLLLDENTSVDELMVVLTSSDQRYLSEGFIITAAGRYLGLGTGEQLVRAVTEVRMEAARHANPLTFLPGNIPISEHITRLLNARTEFVACYCDLNDFKPYNDHYGYWRGDAMIRLLASTLAGRCDQRRDFIGHVGGDDFVVLFQSQDWLERCEQTLTDFNAAARSLFDEVALARGGIEAEDRHGVNRFFPLTTLSIGAVPVRPDQFQNAEDVASAAASAKHKAKVSKLGLAVEG
ncbi:MAG: phosphodiesterase [Pseudomonadota bacterium]|nr:phosphodiesterase [Pseudomonadota bacterium]